MTFGDRLRELRKDRGWTQPDLGLRADIPYHSISDWERDRYLPSLPNFAKLARELGVSMDDLYGPVD